MHFCNPRQGYLENLKIVQVFPQDQLHFVYKQVNVSFDTLNFNFPKECKVEMKSALGAVHKLRNAVGLGGWLAKVLLLQNLAC